MSSTTSDYGVITEAGAIRFERLLPGPIERVWSYLVEGDKRARWLADGDMEEREGSEFEMIWRNDNLSTPDDPAPENHAGEHRGRIIVIKVERPRLLVQRWQAGSEVTYELAERGDQVLLTLTHRKIQDRETLVKIAGGWHAHLGLLRSELEGSERESFWSTHGRLEAEYQERIPT